MKRYITFRYSRPSESGKTKIYSVRTTDGIDVGEIRWYAQWRCYAFYPFGFTTFEHKCLRRIADFCEKKTIAHRRKK